MQIFQYPYVIITVIAVCFAALAGVGIHFAVRGLKTAKGQTETDFSTVSRLERDYKKTEDIWGERGVVYLTVSAEDLHDRRAEDAVFRGIKPILLHAFSEDGGAIAASGEKSFVALTHWGESQAQQQAEALQAEVNKFLQEQGLLNLVQLRLGLFAAVGTHVPFDEAMLRAKQACALAKQEGRFFAQWSAAQGKALEKKRKIENSIEREIDNNRFFLEYQPVLDAKTKEIIGAEVLSRLNSQSDGVLHPGNFLHAVDSVGLNDKFDYYIFEKNCKWISNDKAQREAYKYTINFSRTTLSEPAFAEKIISIAEKYGLQFSCLAVEILEDKNITGEARQRMIDNLSALKDKGVSILLDDFGSGFTTFGDLQNLDISIVKIDRTITQNAVTDTGFIILKNIIQTAKDIGFQTLCEGVETQEQEDAAIRAGCDLLQGYFYYRPMSVSMLEQLFGDRKEGK